MVPEQLAPIISAVLAPSTTPHLLSVRLRELGQPMRGRWEDNPAVVALCDGLRARREAGCPLESVPRLDAVVNLKSVRGRKAYTRAALMEPGERLNGLINMLVEAQGVN